MTSNAPALSGESFAAVAHRGSHMQIIASAGAGKTEVVSQRVVSLIAEGVDGRSIVAFTFTEKAASELKDRIVERTRQIIGPDAIDRLSGLFVGTIHAYCFQLLQRIAPRYETYDVLDEGQTTALLAREGNRLDIKSLSARSGLYDGIKTFRKNADVVENELLDLDDLEDPFRSVYGNFLNTLDKYRLLTFGLQIVKTVESLSDPVVQAEVHETLRHLIVDEYQDINPAQERLIELLTGPQTELCVVGDDDQAIYQWRGSKVENILTFSKRYPKVKQFTIAENRRSRPLIVDTANWFAKSIPNRLSKTMIPTRASAGESPEVAIWTCDTEEEEAGYIAQHIIDLAEAGVRFSDIAVLARTGASFRTLLETFLMFDIPVQPAGRVGLFTQPDAEILGKTWVWLVDHEWAEQYKSSVPITDHDVFKGLEYVFDLSRSELNGVKKYLKELKKKVPESKFSADLVGEFYDLLNLLGVKSWDPDNPISANRLGTLARFGQLLADYEMVRRRARPDDNSPGEQVGGEGGGVWYYRGLSTFINHYASGSYKDFGGEEDPVVDAVALNTIHGAKGLEWPIVFIPCVTANRFPPRNQAGPPWLIDSSLFDKSRYDGTEADERRLFYTALTRARDWVGVSRHERIKNRVQPSPFFQEMESQGFAHDKDAVVPSPIEVRGTSSEVLNLTYSQISAFQECGLAYRLRDRLGFPVRFAAELGYGKAVHHVLRTVAETVRAGGSLPDKKELDRILDESFFLPAANKAGHKQMKAAAKDLISEYVKHRKSELERVWETERPFELRLDGVNISGRADVILDYEDGKPSNLAIVDYKTSTKTILTDHDLQLQIYMIAGRREGLTIDGAYVHDLRSPKDKPHKVKASEKDLTKAEKTVVATAQQIKRRQFVANPGTRCRYCEVKAICGKAKR
jgi:DNA helicase-2/ATP-dependent DNA helicase PcrA